MKRLILILAVITLISSTACASPSEQPTPSPAQETTPAKLTLDDAPQLLNISLLLPASFERVDPASEGLSNEDLGLGSDFGDVELFMSEEPFQMIYCILGIVESRAERALTDAVFKDEQQLESLLIENLKAGAMEEGIEVQIPEIRISYPDLADLAVLGEGTISSYGLNVGFDTLWFKSNKVYVFTYSLYYGDDYVSLVPVAQELAQRIAGFSQ